MCVKKNDIVGHDGNQHDCHFQLMVYSKENGTGNQAQNATVDKILEEGEQIKQEFTLS